MTENKYRYCFWFSKKGFLIFISHLDLMRLFERVFARSAIPVLYSCGFNPHPRFSLPYPLSLGCAGENELAEIFLNEAMEPAEFKKKLNSFLPAGIVVEEVLVDKNCPDLAKSESIEFTYKLELKRDLDKESLLQRLADKEYCLERVNKKGKVIQDKINDFIKTAEITANKIKVKLKMVNGRTLKTEQLFKFFNIEVDQLVDISRSIAII